MDQIASLLLSFSPDEESSNELYHSAAKAHVKRINQLKKDQDALLTKHAPRLLQHVDPAYNSISYAYLLQALHYNENKDTNLPEDILECTLNFLLTFDPRQIRYAGAAFSSILDVLKDGTTFPPSIAVELLASALLRLDPTGSMFTSHHLPLVELAYHTGHIDPILPVISRSIVFYPGMRGQTETRPLCDTRLPPSAYISVESGLTARITSTTVLRYDMVAGLAHLSKRDWASASAAFERVCTFPTRDFGCSRIMTDAYGKWVLTGLLLSGKLRSWPPAAQGAMTHAVLRSFATMGRPYVALAKAFEKGADEGGPDELREAFEAGGGEAFWAEEENLGLVREVLAHYQRHHILRLREVYAKIPLEDIRLQTHSGETGGPLGSAAEIEALLREMIASGMLAGVVEKPEGAVEGDGQGHLTFLSEGEELSESRFAAEIAASAQRIADLAPVVEVTNERLGTSRDYVRYIAKEQRKEKESASGGLTAHVGGGGGVGYKDSMFEMGFDSQIEDEDLMTGLLREGGS